MDKGKVYIVGAGPGAESLITMRGLELICEADAIVFDRLINPALLKYADKKAKLVDVGKKADFHPVPQEEINDILVKLARRKLKVVRLKGGDPYIFGRGAEECLALKENNIEFEVVPGISAAIGASAFAGIPLTHRNNVTQCIFITAHEADKNSPQVEWDKIARLNNISIVIYMGVSQLEKVIGELLKFGRDKHDPVSIIENATLPEQRIIITTLGKAVNDAKTNNINPPSLFIISPTVSFQNDLNWSSKRSLSDRKIIITRASDQASKLEKELLERGAKVNLFPVIRTKFIQPKLDIKKVLKDKWDWIIFSSENGVRYFFELLEKEGLDSRIFGDMKIAVVGSGTAHKLNEYGLKPDYMPGSFTTEDLFKGIKNKIKGKNVIRVGGIMDEDVLLDSLKAASKMTKEILVYKTEKEKHTQEEIKDLLAFSADAVIFTSSSTVKYFFEILGKSKALKLLDNRNAFSIGPITSKTLKDFGVGFIHSAKNHNLQGIVDYLEKVFKEK